MACDWVTSDLRIPEIEPRCSGLVGRSSVFRLLDHLPRRLPQRGARPQPVSWGRARTGSHNGGRPVMGPARLSRPSVLPDGCRSMPQFTHPSEHAFDCCTVQPASGICQVPAGRQRVSRSNNARQTRLTYDHLRPSVCRVPRLPDDDAWLLRERRAIGDRIRIRRIHENRTQESVYLAADIGRSTYQAVEAGAADARISTLLKIAHVLGVHVSALLRD